MFTRIDRSLHKPLIKLVRCQLERANSTNNGDHRHRSFYKYFVDIQTRWRDNDVYGHVNNVVYAEWIDTIVNHYLIEKCSLQPQVSKSVGFVVSSYCDYYSPLSYPMKVSLALSVKKIGRSSVDYQVGIFADRQEKASAVGGFRHVFVDRATGKSNPIPNEIRSRLSLISTEQDES